MVVQRLSADQQDQVWERWRAGASLSRIGRDLGVPLHWVRGFLMACGGVRRPVPRRPARALSAAEREEVSRGLAAGWSCRVIAAGLGRPGCTVSREVARNGGREHYRAGDADRASEGAVGVAPTPHAGEPTDRLPGGAGRYRRPMTRTQTPESTPNR